MVAFNHDASGYEPQSFELLPAGKYTAQIENSELKTTKDGTGEYLALMFKVLGPKHAGRTVFTNLNIKNRNPKTVEIAMRQLSELCHATGVIRLDDTAQLHGIPVEIRVGVQDGKDGYEPQNTIKGYSKATGAPAQGAPAPATSSPPWAAGGSDY